MAYNIGAGTSRGSQSRTSGGSGISDITYGRVIDIILDSFHPEYDTYGKSQSINGILYRPLSKPNEESEPNSVRFAFQGQGNLKFIPVKNEIVELRTDPGNEDRDALPEASKTYYTRIIPIWNHPHHNGYPDTLQSGEGEADFGPDFKETDKVNPLLLFPGDITLEGRHGQSIRMTGTKGTDSPWIDSSNNGSPLTIIRTGQTDSPDGSESILEDINKDKSSIYLTSDHKIELTQANEKREAWEKEPVKADKYKGEQVIINSGRLYFNSYKDGIYLSGTTGVGINAEQVGIDGDKYVAVDAKKVYLGTIAFKEKEPVLKGKTSTDWLNDFISQFETIVKGMATAPPVPAAYVAKMVATANSILPVIPILKQQLKNLHSRKVYTE